MNHEEQADYDRWLMEQDDDRMHRHLEGADREREALQARIAALEAENTALRALLWLYHGHDELSSDDGDLQCAQCNVDFKRAPMETISDAISRGYWRQVCRAIRGRDEGGKNERAE